MRITRKTNILIKTERRLTVKSPSTDESVICDQCREPMISAQTFADVFGFSSRIVYRLIESDKIHFVETAANEIKVCPNCVKDFLKIN